MRLSGSSSAVRALTLSLALGLVGAACGSQVGPGGGSPSGPAASGQVPSGPAPSSLPPASPIKVGSAPFIPQIVSSETVVGRDRFLLGILDPSGTKPIGGPDSVVTVGFSPNTGPAATIPFAPARFVLAIPGEIGRGIFVVNVTFPTAGDWTANVTSSGPDIPTGTVQVSFQVAGKGSAVPVGGLAPMTRTPTLPDVGGNLAELSTDAHPDLNFYTTSVDEALRQHRPFVLVFATPAFCTSRQCGPTLDGVKALAKFEPAVVFINVEPYQLSFKAGRLQPVLDANGQLQATDVTRAWGILSEPWVFVVDRAGIVRGSFEAVFSPDELKASVDAVK